ncbi:MAG TPA: MotA/TolQ/ExbB proton channel family protein, partial [Roseivirga sp.]
IQTIAAVVMVVLSVICAKTVLSNQMTDSSHRKIRLIKELGLFALIIGLLASAIDLMGAFQAIEMAGDVSPSVLAGGLKITFISSVYGLMIYALSLLIYFALRAKTNPLTTK